MGGRAAFNFVGDVLVFDTVTEEMRLEAESREDYLEFQAYGLQCARISKN